MVFICHLNFFHKPYRHIHMCTAQHLEPDCHFAFSAYCQQFSFQTGKGALYHFYGVSFGKRGATYLNGFGQTVVKLEYARTYSAQRFRSHQQVRCNVRQRCTLDDFGLILHELVVALARCFEPPGVGLHLRND